jgi:prefoldin beta subunit
MKIDQITQEKLQELQMAEQGMQNILMQKQAFQMELNESESAIEETKKAEDDVYKILGNIMIKAKKQDVLKELEEKKNIFSLRIKTLENQEKMFSEKFEKLKSDIEKELKKQK